MQSAGVRLPQAQLVALPTKCRLSTGGEIVNNSTDRVQTLLVPRGAGRSGFAQLVGYAITFCSHFVHYPAPWLRDRFN